MDISFKTCTNDFRETLLDFIWKQWRELGVSGAASSGLPWFIDPEPLILFSLDIARYDARVFDEILDWLIKNGNWINAQRLVSLHKFDRMGDQPLLKAVAKTIRKRNKSAFRWKYIEKFQCQNSALPAPLFIIQGNSWRSGTSMDDIFLEYGFQRSPVMTRGMSLEPPMRNPRCIALMIRALLGVNVRADVVTYLSVHGEGHPSHIARALGFSQKQVQDTLLEMAQSTLVSVRKIGHRKDYRLDTERWNPFLYGKRSTPPEWVDWRSLLRGLNELWKGISKPHEKPVNKYIASSIAREAMRRARSDLSNSCIGVNIEDDQPYKAEEYLDIFIRDMRRIKDKLLS
ncbi:hypothetical protein JW926_04335 [Candidatus Sumerlaeota bacterium]|nr:hypothetical protein [Candidatus Sumerlaeota bacterium]